MQFQLIVNPEAIRVLAELDRSDPGRAVKVRRTFAKMQHSIRSKGLSTHEYRTVKGPNGAKVYEAYAENDSPKAYRVIWHYGPGKGQITVMTVIPHPD